MAFLDFLSKDVGGYNNVLSDPGGLGTFAQTGKTGVTWGNILGAAMQSESKPGSSAPAFGRMIGNKYNLPLYQMPQKKEKGSDAADVLSILGAMFGIGF